MPITFTILYNLLTKQRALIVIWGFSKVGSKLASKYLIRVKVTELIYSFICKLDRLRALRKNVDNNETPGLLKGRHDIHYNDTQHIDSSAY
jgi:hypothetical protein